MTQAHREHPLRAIRRTGVVVGTSHVPVTVTVNLGGDTTNLELPYLATYGAPTVGDVVVILGIDRDNIVLGPLAQWLNLDGSTGIARRSGGRLIGSANSLTNSTLATIATDVATGSSFTFTLPVSTIVKIQVQVIYILGTTTAGGALLQAAYSPGSVADTSNMTKLTRAGRVYNNSGLTTNTGASTATAFGYVTLAAGTYTAFGAAQRSVGGSATDVVSATVLGVEDWGT